jgi:AcrR family transcriptional regulator
MKPSSSPLGTGRQTRSARRREATRDQIVRAAERVMAEKGVHATKIADIAAAADVGVGTFYLHFETKQELFDELVADAVARLQTAIEEARQSTTDPMEQVRAATRAVCRFASDNRSVFRIVFGHGGTYHDVVRDAQAVFAADLESVLRTGVASGRVGAVDPGIAAEAVVGMTTQLLAWWTAEEGVSIDDLEATLTTLTVRGLAPEGA